MATPGQLTQAFARSFAMPVSKITGFDRQLAEAGLRSKHGRGRGAAKVDAGDAARLLTAVLASAQAQDAVHSVRRYQATRLNRTTSVPGGLAEFGVVEFAALGREHSFVDALEAIIRWVAGGAQITEDGQPSLLAPPTPLMEITAATPATVGELRIAGIGERVLTARYTLPDPGVEAKGASHRRQGLSRQHALREQALRSDLEQFRRISARTIFDVAEVLINDD